MIFQMLGDLANRVGIIIVIAFILSKVKIFRKLVSKNKISYLDKLIFSIFFGILGIIGTYSGIYVKGALANSRVIGVFVGGLLGGPCVGITSGIIAGLHRWAIGGFTALSCGISTIVEGVLAGLVSKKFYKSNNKLSYSLIMGAIAECIQMIIILIIARPISAATELVSLIAIPMIVANSLGIAIFIGIIESIFKDQERAAAIQAQKALRIANKTLKYLRKGFNEETAYKTAKIIYDMTDVKAVAITDTEKILAHVGIGEDHHRTGDNVRTELTKEVIKTGKYKVAKYSNEISCNFDNCRLKSAIIVPLKERNITVGTLKLYKTAENSISQIDLELALGLASLFSNQIELSKLEYQEELLAKAELKALQAQINPHFLFNAINTIVSFVRTKPDKARELLLHLGSYFRKNLQQGVDEVDLKKEIEHIKSYLEIEKARFDDKLDVNFHIDKDIKCKLPPLILQPIVENAVKHGILQKLEGGTIDIWAKDKENGTELIVQDDGIGMSEQCLQKIFNNDKNKGSIGLVNVNNRLKNKYGDKYGLQIESKVGQGTKVTMLIPKDKGANYDKMFDC
ncbi:sensor histidine kinase [Caldisalinibacter kiritimatiensis]|uniref:histidine kinase n=1 Tax=Caldisalinibacter kiritimatiensis TaxID=1304284 RepID=R1CAY2_9FIRM|nr:sensor histidine kinase [Caldisalinibacter kiritimatiensis]EOC99469.1 Autolysis histidine kinase LytS [Caldisalinibacter kiritimatiensis]